MKSSGEVWYIVGIFLVVILSMYAPKLAGMLVILTALSLGFAASRKQLI